MEDGFTADVVTKDVVKVMRLRLLLIITCTSMIKTADVEEQRNVVEIGKQLSRAFVQGRKKVLELRYRTFN
ncbi:hypothetical protein PPTG_21779 [Phytophthora nicotianae INRA-310]|uniref:Uncharacterized protein n=4 Tax=Phytophthora nicotianae TaxID=4792 RepID=W2QWW0_PHYN3|nr:hypothetical protein PPTG_21779 [Phytophthora nicotianae INRA-310]ETN16755.1 hypothetical protein PPTG_21779 [Phytophthora nicotianae INRA-310]